MEPVLLAGFARRDISPEESVPLAGFGRSSSRMSEGVMDPLHANCLALTGGGNTVLITVMDLPNMYPPLPSMREDISKATGLGVENIMLCCTHTHSAPHLSNDAEPSIPRYCEKLRRCLVEAALEALADQKEATLLAGSIRTQSMNFVRRYILEDGTYAGDNYGHFKRSPIASHETDADPQLQVVKFLRKGGKDLVMVNFQGHPHRAAKPFYYQCTSDLVGVFRRELEAAVDCYSLYFSGASGNVNCHSRVPEENIHPDYIAHGQALARYVQKALEALHPVAAGPVRTGQILYEGKANHTEDHKLEQAKLVVERWKAGAKSSEARRGMEDLFNSPYHALSIINKASLPETLTPELNGISFGGISMVFAPFELFDALGMRIKAGSPFDTTFVCCYANKIFSYMPSQLGFDHGGYGPNQCRFVPGTGEIIADKFLEILRSIHENG